MLRAAWVKNESLLQVVRERISRSAHLDAILPDISEHLHETRGAKKLPNLFAKIDEL